MTDNNIFPIRLNKRQREFINFLKKEKYNVSEYLRNQLDELEKNYPALLEKKINEYKRVLNNLPNRDNNNPLNLNPEDERFLKEYFNDTDLFRCAVALWELAMDEGPRQNFGRIKNIIEITSSKKSDRGITNILKLLKRKELFYPPDPDNITIFVIKSPFEFIEELSK